MKIKNIILILVVVGIVGTIFYFESQRPDQISIDDADIEIQSKEEKTEKYEPAKELVGTQGFINSEPFKIADYIGKKVILIDFWTYSCINCQRTTPYLNAWWDKYEDDGLLIVGVHTPEFEFEKKYENVLEATEKFGIEYPVVQDNNYSTWRAYSNRYWPRKYLIDIDGFIVYDHIGEGAYEETEQKIRELLMERKIVLGESGGIDKDTADPKGVEDVSVRPDSPEVYFGAFRNELLANGVQKQTGHQNLKGPTDPKLNNLYLDGSWYVQKEYAENQNAGAKVIFKFKARKVNLVAESDEPVNIKVFIDGKETKEVTVKSSQLYELVDLPEKGEHVLELIIEDPSARLYTFTFG
ncbi:MAG: thiol-disulfide isomerase [Candidatus Yanofskybacteria bacterium CG10_big_fil_rev_8_21_14_0_10_36_16]|uniref:Thiol-disulfide isomerase n=1 Tax=Candidatus Yanofskybacteria bacterium CG10_big_fil_rev_8_21_14_0_10_36_16 TaxID=1975096 RepID=A0A2J0Q711_9BACT|nr:MAG: thiol-disulfide isomerase [Candidatus Yanofskybacteria bacterium CG10_big_fil_rev_8_21_14_0_10_36_16]